MLHKTENFNLSSNQDKENLKISQKNVKLKSRPKKSINWKLVHEVLNVTKSTQQLATIYTTYATKPILYS